VPDMRSCAYHQVFQAALSQYASTPEAVSPQMLQKIIRKNDVHVISSSQVYDNHH
jgi:hypothetical protein